MQIDLGYVTANLVPMILVLIFTDNHLRIVWRIALGLGVIPPLSLFYLRLKLEEPEEFKRETMKNTRTPWWLVIKYVSHNSLLAVFISDRRNKVLLVSSSDRIPHLVYIRLFGLFVQYLLLRLASSHPRKISTAMEDIWMEYPHQRLLPPRRHRRSFSQRLDRSAPRARPGCLSPELSRIPDGRTLLPSEYPFARGRLRRYIRVSTITPLPPLFLPNPNQHRIFLSLGEAGPGDNIGLVAAKTSATAIRGQYYAVAAASGKIGAFVGTYIFPIIQRNAPGGPDSTRAGQDPFFVNASLCLLSAALAWWALPHIGQDTIAYEDVRFRQYLEARGWDTSLMGIQGAKVGGVGTVGQREGEGERMNE